MSEWTTACRDWERRLIERRSIIPPPIFMEQAERALAIFKRLRVVDLPGKPTFGECCEEWVFDLVRAVFGGYDVETGNQLIREFFLLISKKNAKSTIAAGIMLTATIMCWREGEEHLILAPTKEIADNCFKPAAGMVRADPVLSAMFQVQDHVRTILHRKTKASLKVVAADTDTVGGKKSGRVLVEELWLFGKRAHAEAMIMEATGGLVSRNEGWVIYLSTQSDEPPAGVFQDKLNYFRDVRDGKVHDPRSLPVLYEFPAAMVQSKAYLDPANYYITNPNIGRSVNAGWIEDQLRKQQHKTDGSFQQFLAKHLNVEIGLALRAGRWAGADFWLQAAEPGLSLDGLIERCEVITVGIDGGGLDDLLGLALEGRERETGRLLHWGHAWAHEIVLERRQEIAPVLRGFVAAGEMTLVAVPGEDVRQLADIVERVKDAGLLPEEHAIGVDAAGIGAVVKELRARGVSESQITAISQGWKLNGAIKTVERQIAGGELVHCGQALMAWAVGNARTVQVGNAITINKQVSGTAKIDPLMALFDAATLMALDPQAMAAIDDFLRSPVHA